MEGLISKLLEDFEQGRMTRRQLIRSMAMAVVAGPGIAASAPRALGAATAPVPAAAFTTVHVDHISYQVADHARSAAWYADLMGWTVLDQGESQTRLAMGDVGQMIVRNRRTPVPAGSSVTGVVDHISFGIDSWDADRVKQELTDRGHSPRDDFQDGGFESYHVKDPDGWDLQISNRTEVG